MRERGDRGDRGRRAAVGFHVYVLRDPRDGTVFFVGRAEGSGNAPTSAPVQDVASNHQAIGQRIRAIRDDGHEAERVILVDDLSSESEAATVEQAVLSAYHAARLSPTSLVGATHNSPGSGSLVGGPPNIDGFDDPSVRDFVADAAAEIERLATALARAESDLASSESAGFLDGDHRHRLDELILRQESEISRLNATLDRVRALRDLAQWAGRSIDGTDVGSTVRVADLERALG